MIGQLTTRLNNAEGQPNLTEENNPSTSDGRRSMVPSTTISSLAIQEHRRLFTRQSVSELLRHIKVLYQINIIQFNLTNCAIHPDYLVSQQQCGTFRIN